MDFSERVRTGSLANHENSKLPQLGMIDFIPEKGIACPQCNTVFVAGKLEACSFCDWKEGRVPEEGWKSLEYRNLVRD